MPLKIVFSYSLGGGGRYFSVDFPENFEPGLKFSIGIEFFRSQGPLGLISGDFLETFRGFNVLGSADGGRDSKHGGLSTFCLSPGRRSLGAKSQKVSKKSRKSLPARGPESPEKVSKKVRKVSKNPFSDFFLTFRSFFETFFGLLHGARPRETIFETFLRLFGFGPRDSFSQVHGTSTFSFNNNRMSS